MPFRPASRPKDNLIPAYQLLLCCVQAALGHDRRHQINALLRSGIDWSHLFQLAQGHRILPLCQQALNGKLPAAAESQLLALHKRHVERSFLLTRQLVTVIDLFRQANIPLIPYKGPVLAQLYYGNLSLRQFSDLDLLIRRGDLDRAKLVLAHAGYRPHYVHSQREEVTYLKASFIYDYHFIRDDIDAQLELHWQVTSTFPLPAADIWARTKPDTVLGRTILRVAPEDLLLVLCEHGAKHRWGNLQWICDVGQLLRRHPDLDWDVVLATAHQIGRWRTLFLGLFLARDLLAAKVPEPLWQIASTDHTIRGLARQARLRLFHGVEGPPGVWYSLLLEEHWPDKLRYLLKLAQYSTAPTHHDQNFFGLPPSLSFLYYVLRPLRLMMKSGSTLKNYLTYQYRSSL